MSIESRQREVARYKKEIAGLQKKDADEAKKEVTKADDAWPQNVAAKSDR